MQRRSVLIFSEGERPHRGTIAGTKPGRKSILGYRPLSSTEKKRRWRRKHRMVAVERITKECACLKCAYKLECEIGISTACYEVVKKFNKNADPKVVQKMLNQEYRKIREAWCLRNYLENTEKSLRLFS